ncbi:type II toxin-antitoxin system VapC family toxin [uncultured Agrobacterium sp.]|uniref:type II toxin-antitoxin system VapC family toxin n=1 Tax=uncultured Agrobacterium sp. TaxID=157277 RepID=UPI002587E716|nr:type II toxin-antitoxin system VapC family toxin [uncultured Agrobacterium sp.]
MNRGLLLDTCAIIWMANGDNIAIAAENAVNSVVADGGELCVSAISAWEIGMLSSRRRLPITKDALAWFEEFVSAGEITVKDATPSVLVAASFLPTPLHNDPMDRIIIATAREHDLTIITRDRAILAYGAAGYVKTLAC